MEFEANHNITLDNSVPILVHSDEIGEYIFQFALNKKEILDLQSELKKALRMLKERK